MSRLRTNTYVSRLRITDTYRGLLSAISVLVAQWLERLTGDQKVAGSIPVYSGAQKHFPELGIKLE